MEGWAGFTEEDLQQLKQGSSPGLEHQPRVSTGVNSKQAFGKKQKHQRNLLGRQRAEEFSQINIDLPPNQKLSQTAKSESHRKLNDQEKPSYTKTEAQQTSLKLDASSDQNVKTDVDIGDKQTGISEKEDNIITNGLLSKDIKELDEQEALRLELSRVEQFRLQQQKMEEENKQRCKMLAEAIKQRSKEAKAEAEKLVKVQKELNHLDNLVTADVSIIRDRIEIASMEFLQAQKRYERAEKEFVAAKLALAEKSELKESLTEHLYTIIQQNEVRKAARLACLMKELGLEGDSCLVTAPIPPLLSFSPINTLHRPGFSPTSPVSADSHELYKQPPSPPAQVVPEPFSTVPKTLQLQETDIQIKPAVSVVEAGDSLMPPASSLKEKTTEPVGENTASALESQDGGAETNK